MLFRENQTREELFVIAEGRVELSKTEAYGAKVKVASFGAGDFLGEGSWEKDSLPSTTAAVIEAATVLGLGREFFTLDAALSLKILSNIMRVISRRMRNANAMMISSAAQYESGRTRQEHDLLGERLVTYVAYCGVTLSFFPALVEALAMVKKAAAVGQTAASAAGAFAAQGKVGAAAARAVSTDHNVVDLIVKRRVE